MDAHLCCGSAGTYSLLHPALSQPLLRNKVVALESDGPAVVATANIGCLQHIQSGNGDTGPTLDRAVGGPAHLRFEVAVTSPALLE